MVTLAHLRHPWPTPGPVAHNHRQAPQHRRRAAAGGKKGHIKFLPWVAVKTAGLCSACGGGGNVRAGWAGGWFCGWLILLRCSLPLLLLLLHLLHLHWRVSFMGVFRQPHSMHLVTLAVGGLDHRGSLLPHGLAVRHGGDRLALGMCFSFWDFRCAARRSSTRVLWTCSEAAVPSV